MEVNKKIQTIEDIYKKKKRLTEKDLNEHNLSWVDLIIHIDWLGRKTKRLLEEFKHQKNLITKQIAINENQKP